MRIAIVAIALTATASWAQKKPVTIEATLARTPAVPVPNWSPGGARFLINSGTKLMVREVATGAERELVDLKALDGEARTPASEAAFSWENRGVKERPIQWSSDGKHILVTRSGDLFLLDAATGAHTQLTKTSARERDAKLSPDGKHISYRLGHDLQSMEVATRKTKALTKGGTELVRNAELDWVYPEELALGTAYWWSPDSRHIAYLQFDISGVMSYPHGDLTQVRPVYEPQRFPQAGTPNSKVRLGIVADSGGATKWVDLPALTGGSLIARVDWLPDSSGVAVALLNRVQNELRWVRTGSGKGVATIYTHKDPTWINFKDDYRFLTKPPRLLFGAELPDYRHLYWKSLEAGTGPIAITKGDWEVTGINCVDEVNRRVYYISTEVSPVERHLFRVGFDGSGKTRLTAEPGTHVISMPHGCAFFTDRHSSLALPPRLTLHAAADGKLMSVLQDRDSKVTAEYELLPAQLMTFRDADGAVFHASLIKPAGFDPAKKYPAIVEVYGGPHAQNVKDAWRGADFAQYLAHRGFVIWQMDNRGTAGRGHAWESKLFRRFGKQELEDQVEGVKHLVSLGFVDPARVGLSGWSYGGFMTLYGLLNAPGQFAAGIAGAPVTDWRQYDTIYTERYLGMPQENEDGYKASSPVYQADKLRGKLMLVHNFEDDNVLFQHSLRMADSLQQAGKPFELMLYPQKVHGVTGAVERHMFEGMAAFWERHLGAVTAER